MIKKYVIFSVWLKCDSSFFSNSKVSNSLDKTSHKLMKMNSVNQLKQLLLKCYKSGNSKTFLRQIKRNELANQYHKKNIRTPGRCIIYLKEVLFLYFCSKALPLRFNKTRRHLFTYFILNLLHCLFKAYLVRKMQLKRDKNS